MKKYLLLALFMSTLFHARCSNKNESGQPDSPLPNDPGSRMEKVSYKTSDQIICNPERGFYTHHEFSTGDSNAITPEFVKEYRKQGISLIFTVYYMQGFRDKLISAEYLQRIRKNMQALRDGGSKAVLRFAYTSSESQKPWDASWELTQQHIQQLKPILDEYSDVICVLEAGFVGVWGEWYYTDNYTYQPKKDQYEPRRKVLNDLLSVMPKDRMVAVRYPVAKLYTFNISHTDNITSQTAYNGSDLSRIAFHNDCFLADSDDVGTFQGILDHRKFWERETKYVAMGGETCGKSEYSACENALSDFEKYHWSYINIDYHPEVIGQWNQEKCMAEIKKRLGYRFTLSDGSFTEKGEIGNPYKIELNLQNIGWAAPFNPRDVEIIFISKKKKDNKYRIKLKDDPRFWFPSEKMAIISQFKLPETMEKGEYDIYLNLPDPRETISSRWEYSIQLANENVWNSTYGYNKIHSVSLSASSNKIQFNGESLEKF